MKKYESKLLPICKVKLFKDETVIPYLKRRSLSNLVFEKNDWSTDDIRTVVSKEDYKEVLCVEDSNSELCGYASVEDSGDEGLYLSELFVGYSDRGKGFGKKLLEATRAYALKLWKEYVDLVVTADNKRARRLYEKWGFYYKTFLPGHKGAYVMKMTTSKAVLYQGRLLGEIAESFGVSGMVEGFNKAVASGELLECVEDFNKKFPADQIDIKAVGGGVRPS